MCVIDKYMNTLCQKEKRELELLVVINNCGVQTHADMKCTSSWREMNYLCMWDLLFVV